ncbi:MAG TPA: methyltransferase [Rhizomicrobium sp.]|jgi:protein-S-isoprenylcysteine O-methyltransferase Ste14
MLQQILTGQAKGIALLVGAIALYLYFLPSILAFLRGQRRFWAVLVLNILLSPVQGAILRLLAPDWSAVDAAALLHTLVVAVIANFGFGWVLLLVWTSRSGATDARLLNAQNTKLYDTLAALPLILWFAYGALQLRPVLVGDAVQIQAGTATLYTWVQLFSLSAAAAFDLLLVYLLVVRDRPVRKSKGVAPRMFGVLGTFMGVGILQLPVAQLTLPMQIVSAVLVGVGSLASFLVLWRLGKSFSILPEARTLVTGGPYAWARHPLYTVEMITIVGTAMQFVQPWAGLVAVIVVVLLVIRSHYEEGVLAEAYPEYVAYRAKTARFIPRVI